MNSQRSRRGKNRLRAFTAVLGFLAILAALACRKSDRYLETRGLVTRYIQSVEDFAAAVAKAEDAKTIAAAMDTWTGTALGLAPALKELGRKRPELSNASVLPPDLTALLIKMDESHARMLTAMAKAMRYADDPAVLAARAKLEEVQKILE
jgi:hypothetical protein